MPVALPQQQSNLPALSFAQPPSRNVFCLQHLLSSICYLLEPHQCLLLAGGGSSCNWLALKAALHQQKQQHKQYKHRLKPHKAASPPAVVAPDTQLQQQGLNARSSNSDVTSVLALDCEMVGVGPMGIRSALAR